MFKRVKALKPGDLSEFIGRTLLTMEGERVKVETITGSLFKPTRFEINGKHHVVALSAYMQLNGEKITPEAQEVIDAFDETTVEHIERAGPQPLDRPKEIKHVESN